jgi:hypothetical protein
VARPVADPGEIDFAMVLPIYQPLADQPLAGEAPGRRQGQ